MYQILNLCFCIHLLYRRYVKISWRLCEYLIFEMLAYSKCVIHSQYSPYFNQFLIYKTKLIVENLFNHCRILIYLLATNLPSMTVIVKLYCACVTVKWGFTTNDIMDNFFYVARFYKYSPTHKRNFDFVLGWHKMLFQESRLFTSCQYE